MTAVSVNGVGIDAAAIAAEAQHHPAASPQAAWNEAVTALAIRELLLQQARRLGIEAEPEVIEPGRTETDEDALVRALLEREISIPVPDDASLKRYYRNNRAKFRAPDLFEASHILFAAAPGDDSGFARAIAQAETVIEKLAARPEDFAALARKLSDCPSGRNGGCLGQISLGDTVPEFETFLCNLDEGQLCPIPVRSRFGAHVLRLDRKISGSELPFEAVRTRIADYLTEASWRRAVAQYIRLLAGAAEISGVELGGVQNPLVQ